MGNEKPAGQASPRKKTPPPGRNENAEASGNLTEVLTGIMSNLKEQGQNIAKLGMQLSEGRTAKQEPYAAETIRSRPCVEDHARLVMKKKEQK